MARKMKDSGIEWIGEIPEGWRITTIGRLFGATAGGDVKPQLYSDIQDSQHPYPVFTNSSNREQVYAYTSKPMFTSNTITVTGRGDIGHAFFRDMSYDAIIRLLVLTPKFDLDCRYYAYWIDNVISFFTNGSAVAQLSAQQVLPYKIAFLPIGQQHVIANHLDFSCHQIDAVLSKIRTSIEEYKKLKQAVITQAITKGVRGEREMKDSGVEWIGEIPVDWTIQRFARVAEVKSNLVSPDNYLEYPQISPENIEKDSGKLLLPCKTVGEVGIVSGNHLFYKGQILYSKIRPKLNKVCIAPFDGLCSADMYPIETNNDTRYIMYCILSNGFLQQVSMITENRVKMPKINQTELSKLLVAIPNYLAEQKEIADYLDAKCAEIDRLIAKKEQLVKELESYKKSLIYEVVTGKREV